MIRSAVPSTGVRLLDMPVMMFSRTPPFFSSALIAPTLSPAHMTRIWRRNWFVSAGASTNLRASSAFLVSNARDLRPYGVEDIAERGTPDQSACFDIQHVSAPAVVVPPKSSRAWLGGAIRCREARSRQ